MAHVTRAEVAVNRLVAFQMRVIRQQTFTQQGEQLVQTRAFVDCDVIDLVDGFRVRRRGCEQIHLHGVIDVTEVAAGPAIAVDLHPLVFHHGRNPFGNDRGVGAVRVLARTEHVEVAQADGLHAVAAGENVRVQFVRVFGDGVGRERSADDVLDFG